MQILQRRWSRIVVLFFLALFTEALLPTTSLAQSALAASQQRDTLVTVASDNEAGYYAGNGSTSFHQIAGNVIAPCIKSGTKGSTLAIMMGMGGVYDNGRNSLYVGFLDSPGGVIRPFYTYSQAATAAINPTFFDMPNIACGDSFSLIVFKSGTDQAEARIIDETNPTQPTGDILNQWNVDWKSAGVFVARDYCPSIASGGAYAPLTQFPDVSWSGINVDGSALGTIPTTRVTMVNSKKTGVVLAQASTLSTANLASNFTSHWVGAGSDGNPAC